MAASIPPWNPPKGNQRQLDPQFPSWNTLQRETLKWIESKQNGRLKGKLTPDQIYAYWRHQHTNYDRSSMNRERKRDYLDEAFLKKYQEYLPYSWKPYMA